MEKCQNCDESGRESTKMDEHLCKKRCCGVEGLKNGPKMSPNPLKKFKSPILIEILKIPKNPSYFRLFFRLNGAPFLQKNGAQVLHSPLGLWTFHELWCRSCPHLLHGYGHLQRYAYRQADRREPRSVRYNSPRWAVEFSRLTI